MENSKRNKANPQYTPYQIIQTAKATPEINKLAGKAGTELKRPLITLLQIFSDIQGKNIEARTTAGAPYAPTEITENSPFNALRPLTPEEIAYCFICLYIVGKDIDNILGEFENLLNQRGHQHD